MKISSALALSFVQTALAVNPLIALDYTRYQGTALQNGITQWLGMRYAARPIGNLRFAPPQDPLNHTDIQDATKNRPICLGTPGPTHPADAGHDEDCLFISVFSPSNATADSKLPVYFFVQGGGFNTNSNANYNGTGLIQASGYDIVVVNFNYRVGPYGFLASKEVAAGGAINNGLRDQRKALHWVQKYISQFGGDPGHVVLGGDSAGAASVTLQLTAYGGRDDHLFHATAAESQSFAAIRTVDESQYQYDALVKRTGCNAKSDTLQCLRNLSEKDLQGNNTNIASQGASAPPLYMYGPVLDNDIVTDYTYAAFRKGNFIKLPAIYGDDTNEGTIFADKNAASDDDTKRFLKNQFPLLTVDQLNNTLRFYPVDQTRDFPPNGRNWRQCADVYGEMRYICPGIYINGIYANNSVPAWNYRWNVIDPTDDKNGNGVSHTIEVNAIWGPGIEGTNGGPASYKKGQSNYPIVPVVQAYWTNFIKTYNPNGNQASLPTWQQWTKQNAYARLMFQTNNTKMETVPADQQMRCGYLTSIGESIKQ